MVLHLINIIIWSSVPHYIHILQARLHASTCSGVIKLSFFPACPASSSSIWCYHWNTLPRLLLSSTRVYRRGHLLTFLMKIFNLHTKMLLNQLIKSNDIWDEKRKYNKTEIQSLLKIHHRKRQLTMFSAKTWPYTVYASGSLHLIFTPFPAKSNEHNERNWRI